MNRTERAAYVIVFMVSALIAMLIAIVKLSEHDWVPAVILIVGSIMCQEISSRLAEENRRQRHKTRKRVKMYDQG